MRTKEFLTAREVEFESINVADNPDGLKALTALGARSVPVVSKDEAFIYSQDLNQLAKFVGLNEVVQPRLSPAELLDRLETVLNIAAISISQIPEKKLAGKLPGRDRSYLSLANHIFEIANGFTEIANGAPFKGRIAAAQPEKNRSPEELAAYGQVITGALKLWFDDLQDKDCGSDIETFYGTQSLHAVLERCTWHATQHVRQIMMVLDLLDIKARAALQPEDLLGLPLPNDVWD